MFMYNNVRFIVQYRLKFKNLLCMRLYISQIVLNFVVVVVILFNY